MKFFELILVCWKHTILYAIIARKRAIIICNNSVSTWFNCKEIYEKIHLQINHYKQTANIPRQDLFIKFSTNFSAHLGRHKLQVDWFTASCISLRSKDSLERMRWRTFCTWSQAEPIFGIAAKMSTAWENQAVWCYADDMLNSTWSVFRPHQDEYSINLGMT